MQRILVIDDDEALRAMIARTLTIAGYQVLQAKDGDEGLRTVRDGHPDIVVTDIVMPGKEGLETIRMLRHEFPALPVIAMSGGNMRSGKYLEFAHALGAEIILEKPFRATELIDSISGLLSRSG